MRGSGEYPTVTVPLEAWRQVVRRVRQLESLRRQQNVLLDSLMETIESVPEDGESER
jgi:transposase